MHDDILVTCGPVRVMVDPEGGLYVDITFYDYNELFGDWFLKCTSKEDVLQLLVDDLEFISKELRKGTRRWTKDFVKEDKVRGEEEQQNYELWLYWVQLRVIDRSVSPHWEGSAKRFCGTCGLSETPGDTDHDRFYMLTADTLLGAKRELMGLVAPLIKVALREAEKQLRQEKRKAIKRCCSSSTHCFHINAWYSLICCWCGFACQEKERDHKWTPHGEHQPG